MVFRGMTGAFAGEKRIPSKGAKTMKWFAASMLLIVGLSMLLATPGVSSAEGLYLPYEHHRWYWPNVHWPSKVYYMTYGPPLRENYKVYQPNPLANPSSTELDLFGRPIAEPVPLPKKEVEPIRMPIEKKK